MRYYLLFLSLLLFAPCVSAEPKANGDTPQALSFSDAVEIALGTNPSIREAEAQVDAARGRRDQANAFLNPSAVARVEGAPGNRNTDRSPEYIVGFSQPLPISGRLKVAGEAESLAGVAAEKELELRQLQIKRAVHAAFATALYAEEYAKMHQQLLDTSERSLSITKARIEQGDALKEDLARAESEKLQTAVGLKRANALRAQAKTALLLSMGRPSLTYSSLAGSLEKLLGVSQIETLAAERRAQVEVSEANVATDEARLKLAKRERIPDVNVDLFYRRLDSREDGFDIGFSVPIPLFHRNRGRIRESAANLAASEARLQSARNGAALREEESRARLENALEALKLLREEIIPRAESVLQSADARYRAGDISLSELLPTRRELITAQQTYLDTVRNVVAVWREVSLQ